MMETQQKILITRRRNILPPPVSDVMIKEQIRVKIPPVFIPVYTDSYRYKSFYGGRGGAKCLALGTKVIMFDGSLKKVEDIRVGDKVMGVDNQPRTVLGTTRGKGKLYKVSQSSAIDYIVNDAHILSLKKSKSVEDRYPACPHITNMNVITVSEQSKKWRDNFRGYKVSGLKFKKRKVSIDPYFLGVWLGDGTCRELRIHTMDKEIIDYCKKEARKYGEKISFENKPFLCKTIGFPIKKGRENPFWKEFKKYNLPSNKHIPFDYIANDEQTRLELLAGIIDTDGTLHNNTYVIAQTNKRLAHDIKYIADTLGFKTNLRLRKTLCTNNGKEGNAWYISISGNAWRIPCKIKHKIINKNECHPNKDFHLSQISINYEGIGEYAGFAIDGDHLFLLEDGTVTHNSWAFGRILTVRGSKEKLRILCTRELQASIADSVYKLLVDQIMELNLEKYYTIQKNTIYSNSGSEFLFKGLRFNIDEIKSLEGIDICWVEEAQSVAEESWKVLIPTIRKEGSEIWASWNTGEEKDATYQRFVVNPPDDCLSVKVSFRDNPYFPETLRREMEYCKRVDFDAYEHIWEGNPLKISESVIFKGKFVVEDFETPDDAKFRYGADWGFANDPAVLIRSFIIDKELFIDYEATGVGIDLDELPDLFDTVPDSRNHRIPSDSARPETISLMKKQGFNTVSCHKWKGSKIGFIRDGIEFIRKFERIHIHSRCIRTADEFRHYSYKQDKAGNILPVPKDAMNHCFVGETLVTTDIGDIPIKDIQAGDKVLTRRGFKRVIKRYDNGLKPVKEYKFANNRTLISTSTHNIITNKGKKEIKDISKQDTLFFLFDKGGKWKHIREVKNTRRSYTKEMLIVGIQTAKEEVTDFISDVLVFVKKTVFPFVFTLQYGKTNMAECQKDITSIIKTETHSTMNCLTWNVCKDQHTHQNTQKNITQKTPHKYKNILQRSDLLQRCGIVAKREESFTEELHVNSMNKQNQENKYASFVERFIQEVNQWVINRCFVLINASLHTDEKEGSIIFRKSVLFVKRFLQRVSTLKLKLVHENVVLFMDNKTENLKHVYDIEVEDQHEYFANGVLVSNSIDALRYSLEDLIKGTTNWLAVMDMED